jgi:hypothetical protein
MAAAWLRIVVRVSFIIMFSREFSALAISASSAIVRLLQFILDLFITTWQGTPGDEPQSLIPFPDDGAAVLMKQYHFAAFVRRLAVPVIQFPVRGRGYVVGHSLSFSKK